MTVAETVTHRDFLSMADLTAVGVQAVLDAAIAIRTGELRPDLREAAALSCCWRSRPSAPASALNLECARWAATV